MIILHAADIHIGAPFASLGTKAQAKRDQLKQTFRALVDVAIAQRATLLLIAGDLFDRNQVAAADVQFVRDQFARLHAAGVRTCLIGGTHDVLDDYPILKAPQFVDGLQSVYLLDDERPQQYFEDVGVAVAGASNYTKKSMENPLAKLRRHPSAPVNIAMLHGSYQIPGKAAKNDFPFTAEDLDASGFDYVACGHWHSMLDISTQRTRAWYAGAAEPFEFNQTGSGHVLALEVQQGKITDVRPIKVSASEFRRAEVDVTGKSFEAVRATVEAWADPQLYLEVVLTGLVSPQAPISKSALQQSLADKFAYVHVVDKLTYHMSPEEMKQFPETMVLGAFIRDLQAQIEAEQDDARRRVKERALQYGISLLTGKDVV